MNTKYAPARDPASKAFGDPSLTTISLTIPAPTFASNQVARQADNIEETFAVGSAREDDSSGKAGSGPASSTTHQSPSHFDGSTYRTPMPAVTAFHGMAGRSPAMRRFFGQIQTAAPYLRVATIEGEEGTGKSTAARILHTLGSSAKGPFVPCLASVFLAEEYRTLPLPWSPSLVDEAIGGMLFLDRVDELEGQQQARLFQFLVWFDDQLEGGLHTVRQVVVSSSGSLRRMAAAEALRSDLSSRLTAIRFLVPPLRERREDIPLLAQFFAQRFSQTYHKPIRGLAPETLAPLLRHSWPGNVRELESVISFAAFQTESQWIRPIDLPVLTSPATPETRPVDNDFNLDRVIVRHIERTLERTRGNKLRAASMLGISRSTLYRILGSAS